MKDFTNDIKNLTRQLYPTGRAFKMQENSFFSAMNDGLILSENRFHQDARGVLSSILPDNPDFTIEDAARWEYLLGMITNDLISLEDRKLAILRKINHPGTVKARQNYLYLQSQLQLAGFDVYVHENIPAQSPVQVLNSIIGVGEMGEIEMGEIEMGSAETYYPDLFLLAEMGEIEMGEIEMADIIYNNMVVNHITESFDSDFAIGDNYKCCFFIGGEVLGTFADVLESRKDEFRQLILKIKPVQTVGILFINYI